MHTPLRIVRHSLVLLLTALSLMACLIVGSCRPAAPTTATGDTLVFRHAHLLTAQRTDSFTRVDIADPWHEGATAATYILVPRHAPLPHNLPSGIVLRTPLARVVAYSAVHAALADELGVLSQVSGVCDVDYITSPSLRAAIQAGQLADYGSSMQPAVEQLMANKVDALLISPFRDQVPGPAEQIGIPVIACADYMEATPLGRAEWMRFYGMLWGMEQRADSLFADVERTYTNLRTQAAQAATRPTLMVDLRTGPVWYVAGGRSTMGTLYADAALEYLYRDDVHSGSVALNFEQVFARCSQADFWLVKYGRATDYTYATLAQDDSRYTRFRPWREHHVVGCNTLSSPFYEETPFHPERLLDEVIQTFHEDLRSPTFAPKYLKPLQP